MGGGLSTHVLDLTAGRPAAGVTVRLSRNLGDNWGPLVETRTDADGRARLLADGEVEAGGYRLAFDIGAYFESSSAAATSPPFLGVVVIDFAIADPAQRCHVPLLVSPFGYSTYRGS